MRDAVPMRLMRCADSGLLVELEDLDAVRALHAGLVEQELDGVLGLVPAERTLLLHLDPDVADPRRIEQAVRATPLVRSEAQQGALLRVPVVYDGEDLAEVARLTGLSEREVVAEHTGAEWTVSFGGFAPGFGYLCGGSALLQVPRRSQPRTHVPSGAVALAGSYSGIYPRQSPGGWQLIGRTDVPIWRSDREPPALLRPGVRVRFEEVR